MTQDKVENKNGELVVVKDLVRPEWFVEIEAECIVK